MKEIYWFLILFVYAQRYVNSKSNTPWFTKFTLYFQQPRTQYMCVVLWKHFSRINLRYFKRRVIYVRFMLPSRMGVAMHFPWYITRENYSSEAKLPSLLRHLQMNYPIRWFISSIAVLARASFQGYTEIFGLLMDVDSLGKRSFQFINELIEILITQHCW